MGTNIYQFRPPSCHIPRQPSICTYPKDRLHGNNTSELFSLDSQVSVAEALALLKEFSNSECFSFTDQRLSEARFNATNMANMLRNDIIDVAYKPKNSNFEIATNSRRKRSTGHLERMKRQTTGNGSSQTGNTTSNNCSSLDNIFSAADVSTLYLSNHLGSK